jgi:hypothetical protein
MVLLAVIQTLVPLAAIIWFWLGRLSTTSDILLRASAAILLTFAAAQAGLWLAMPRMTVLVLAALLLLALFGAFRRSRRPVSLPDNQGGALLWAGRLVTLVGAGIGAAIGGIAIAGQSAVSPAIDLAFPFDEGRYLVVAGGSTVLINPHRETLAAGREDWRGQSHAVDLVRIDNWGFRTRTPGLFTQPADPAAYLTTGTPVIAPCGGVVHAVVNDRPDMRVPIPDRTAIIGNHVALRCGANLVVLAHFKRGSIGVSARQRVRKGDAIGQAGNSGQSGEPHLHIHAQRVPAPGAPLLSGQPVAIRFEARVPVRNMQFTIDGG